MLDKNLNRIYNKLKSKIRYMKRSSYLKIVGAAMLLVTSCQREDLTPTLDWSETMEAAQVSCLDVSNVKQIDDPIVYLADIDFKAWTEIGRLEDKLSACNPSQEVLEHMSTDALVKSIARYPLNFILFAYNNPFDAVNLIADSSLIHRELESRRDAADKIVELFASVKAIEMDPKVILPMGDYTTLQYADEMFLDYYMASGRLELARTETQRKTLGEALNRRIDERMSRSDIFSFESVRPLQVMAASPQLTQYVRSIPIPPTIGTTTVHTPFGRTITAFNNADYSHDEMTAITLWYVLEYPEALSIAPATAKYNCHSYAWHAQNQYNTLWIDANDTSNLFQLSRYWSSDYYVSCSSQQAERAFYGTTADHSALVHPNGLFESKWGRGPLMIHTPEYCPYLSNSITYYKHRSTVPFQMQMISGDDFVQPGQTYIYYRGALTHSDANYSWNITSYPSEYSTTDPYVYSPNRADWAYITFYGEGLYNVRLEMSYEGNVFAYDEKNVYVFDTGM